MTVEVRPVEATDCSKMPAFRRRMEGGAYLAALRDEAFYRCKYLVQGRAVVAVVAGEIAGVIAATPRRVRLAGSVISGAEIGDLFVDPSHRGRGLFRRLHEGLMDTLRSEGVGFLTVRPGPEAQPILRKAFGYRTLFGISEWVAALDEKGLRALPLGRVPMVRSLLPRWRETRAAATGWTAKPDGGSWPRAGVVRDGDWLSARYTSGPTPYRVLVGGPQGHTTGVLVLLEHRESAGTPSRGWLVDGWTVPGDVETALDLVNRGVASLRDHGASIAHFWCAKEVRWQEDPVCVALRRGGFRGFDRGKVVLWRAVAEGGLPEVPSPDSWMFRMGDTDGI